MGRYKHDGLKEISCYSQRLTMRSKTLTPRDMLNMAMRVLGEQTGELAYVAKSELVPLVIERCPKDKLERFQENKRFLDYAKESSEPEPCGDDCEHTFVKVGGRSSVIGELVRDGVSLYEVKQTLDCAYDQGRGSESANLVVITPTEHAPEDVLSRDLESRF